MGNIIKCLKVVVKYVNCHKEKDSYIIGFIRSDDFGKEKNISENGETICSNDIQSSTITRIYKYHIHFLMGKIGCIKISYGFSILDKCI